MTKPHLKRIQDFYLYLVSKADTLGDTHTNAAQVARNRPMKRSTATLYVSELCGQNKLFRKTPHGSVRISPLQEKTWEKPIEKSLYPLLETDELVEKPDAHELLKRELRLELSHDLYDKMIIYQKDMEEYFVRVIDGKLRREQVWKASVIFLWVFILLSILVAAMSSHK